LFSKRDTAVETPEPSRVRARKGGAAVAEMPLRRDYGYAEDYGDDFGVEDDAPRRPGVRLSFKSGLVPKTLWGRIAAGSGLVLLAGAGIAAVLVVRSFLLRDEHFVVEGSSSIQIAGNSQLTRPQLLSVFGGDVERNVFKIPLEERRSELESLPWVAHATVMRLLPNRVRVAIVERTPVAFVRQGKEIELVDANGVLLDMARPVDADGAVAHKAEAYSFPVLTGISAGDPLSVRAARMKIYLGFVAAMDAGGENVSRKLSEVDLSNPEDVKAILPDGGADVLVHFGDAKFLERYHQYQSHLTEWRAMYPKLASVDMRYERQVVLEMQPGSAVPSAGPAAAPTEASAKPVVKAAPVVAKAAVAPVAVAKAPASTVANPVTKTPMVTSPAAKTSAVVSSVVKAPVVAPPKAPAVTSSAISVSASVPAVPHVSPTPPPGGHLTTAFDVHPGAAKSAAGSGQGSAR
jgi:cell division protein FtsQ